LANDARPLDGSAEDLRLSARVYGIVVLCGLVLFIDGFDTQAISYIVPSLAKEWHLSRAVLGPVFSSALVGLMVGYLFVSPLSDRLGHKRLIVGSTIAFGAFTLITVAAHDVRELIGLRFLAGIGLGAAAPSAIALVSEYSPHRLRATFVLAIYCGFSLGFVAAGICADLLLHRYGWRSLLWVGALAPLAIALTCAAFLPRTRSPRVVAPAANERGSAFRALFTGGRALGTVLLWIVFLINLAEFYFMQSWLPTILTGFHDSAHVVVTATTLSTVGGIAAAFVVGPSMDRLGAYRTITVLYLVGAISVALTGPALSAVPWLLLVATFWAGFFVSGGQKSVIALAAVFYPAALRSTGLGWALGIGRLGGIAGPIIGGWLFVAHWSPAAVFSAAAVPMLVAGLVLFALERRYGEAAAARPAASAADPIRLAVDEAHVTS
jgi:AAHS family 4-hydroxybenzoate transporter-like MFS transporter